MSRVQGKPEQGEEELSEVNSVVVPDSLLSVSRSDLVAEQRADPSLNQLFEAVLSPEDGNSAASGYLLQGELLVRKWLVVCLC